jgi:glutamate synthase (ferredoxin)
MSGGIAYVLDEDGLFASRCNPSMIDLEPLTDANDRQELRELILKHYQFTGSRIAEDILLDWPAYLARFIKVTPREYRRALAQLAQAEVASQHG